jgi:anti-sigma regulatory factor (Ser/Thr protein kinase)
MHWSVAFPVNDMSEIAYVRREASAVAKKLGFNETETGRVALIVTEAGANLVKHAQSGELIIRELNGNGAAGIELLALDKGPGIANVSDALVDGYSTAGTPGTGLGAIRRLSDEFDIQSSAETGTTLLARLWAKRPGGKLAPQIQLGAICCCKRGQEVCGDAWGIQQREGRCIIIVIDGLGHGRLACDAAQAALRVFQQNAGWEPAAIVDTADRALRSTRGAALAVAEIDLESELLRFCGVGNIAGVLIAPGSRTHGLVSMNGTVGQKIRVLREFRYPHPKGSMVILHSDGLSSHWNLDRYRGIGSRDPGVIAGLLYRDYERGRDDVTVVVTKQKTHEADNHEDSVARDRNSL